MNTVHLDCLYEETRAHLVRLKDDLASGCKPQLAIAFLLDSLHESHHKLSQQAAEPSNHVHKQFAVSACKMAIRSLDNPKDWNGICNEKREAFRNRLLNAIEWLTEL